MEFWGVEVKNGEARKVDPGNGMIVHISQAALGEVKKEKGTEPIYLYLSVDNQKLVLGTLSHEKFPQIPIDVVLEKRFEVSHSWKNGSVCLLGYKVHTHDGVSETDGDTEEDLPIPVGNAKTETSNPGSKKADAAKSDGEKKKQVKVEEANKNAKTNQEDSDTDEDDDDMSSEESSDAEGQMANGEDDENEGDDSDDDESSDEDIPNEPGPSKKRHAESAIKTPVDKKVKLITPQKTDGKKSSSHVATPHPAKQAGKKPANSKQPNQQTPKSAGSYPCKSCNRSFTTEIGLQSHTKAKHSTAA